MLLIIFGNILPWLIVGFGCWIGYHLIRQNGRILVRLEALETQLTQLPVAPTQTVAPKPLPTKQPQGLLVSTVAPEFELPDLRGERRALSQWREQRLLLIFFNPHCGFCQQMASALAALSIN